MEAINYQARDFFVYSLVYASLAPGAANTQNLSIQADSDFIVQKMAFGANLAGASQTDSTRIIPLATLLIVDSGSGRQLMNIAVDFSSIFGTGQLPFILPQPKIFLAQTNIAVTLTNVSAAETYNIRLSFIGLKGFR